MYMETRAHLNYWSTENFCGRWTLKTGTLIITSITTVWALLGLSWSILALYWRCYVINQNCWLMPEPEVQTITKMASKSPSEALRVSLYCVAVYHGLYLFFSAMVFVGVFKKLPGLLSGWVGLTNIHMVLMLANLFLTLAFTTLVHLLVTLIHFVASLCAWVVVKSYRQQLRVFRTKPPLPDNALLDYTVDGVDKLALDPVP